MKTKETFVVRGSVTVKFHGKPTRISVAMERNATDRAAAVSGVVDRLKARYGRRLVTVHKLTARTEFDDRFHLAVALLDLHMKRGGKLPARGGFKFRTR